MRRLMWIAVVVAVAGCHAHTTAGNREAAKEAPPAVKEVSSPRPVRTTPNAMLDDKATREIQKALKERGLKVEETGQLDQETQKAIREFQKRERMAQTGLPDYGTLRKLGLSPEKIYLGGKKNEAKR